MLRSIVLTAVVTFEHTIYDTTPGVVASLHECILSGAENEFVSRCIWPAMKVAFTELSWESTRDF